ncbi:restriction endonuclease subunit S [Laspinema sp. D1]|uniref:restriction endonuclease subunit S n=1 Tax=Laspinema palackyanum TaxID=3231601 RepID=UPI003488AC48|nr:restriction endonuclease subunit S [Laspinema sp. D2b]
MQEAIEGKLTADWRSQNPDVEPASELLKRIAVEKAQLVKEKKIKPQKPLPPITDEEKPFELPKGWEWCRLGEITTKYEAGKSFKCLDREVFGDEWGVIKTSAITSSIFKQDENKFYRESPPLDQSKKISTGDLIFCRASGSKGLAGICCIATEVSKNLLLSDKTPRLEISTLVEKLFIFFHNETNHTKIYYSSLNTGKSTSMNNITKEQLLAKYIPLPPCQEQQAIVAKVEKLLALCDQLETQITQNQTHAEQLMQAVLKEAFNPNSESTG